MNRTLKLAIMLALATGGGQVWAQNLGPVQMRSTMEQPLVAEIPLTGVSGSLDKIRVALASEEAFSRAGLNRAGLPVELQFAVAKNGSGQPVIRITSNSPVRDTYLDFLVEVSSGSNKVIREVTMLLDPPGTPITSATAGATAPAARPSRTSDVPARVPDAGEPRPSRSEAPAAAPAAPAPATAAPARAAAPVRERPAAPSPEAVASKVGPIQRGQTLSTIAREHASGAQMSQMLVALQKANPDAFYRDNINALKTGAVLRIPSAADVQAESVSSAVAEVRRQNESWRNGTARAPSVVADGASTGASQATGKSAAAANDRLALVPSKQGGDAASSRVGTKDGKGDAQIAGLKQELSNSQESVASLKQQGDELKSRLGDLEDINTKNQRLLSLKDSEIADLQRKLADARKAAAAGTTATAAAATHAPGASATAAPLAMPAVPPAASPAASASVGASASATTAPAVSASTAAPASPATPATSATTSAAAVAGATTTAGASAVAATPASGSTAATTPLNKPAPVTAARPPAVASPASPADDENPWYMQPWAWGVGGVAVLLLLVAAVFSRRKEKDVAVSTPSLAERFGEEPNFDSLEPLEHVGHNHEMDLDQREILDALAEHPDDIGLHLELVSLYYGRRDVEHFEGAAEAMHAHVADEDQPEWREVVMMGEDLAPTHPLFGGTVGDDDDDDFHDGHGHDDTMHGDDLNDDVYKPSTAHQVSEAAALEEFDLGTYVTGPEESDVEAMSPQKHSEYHFNFDLTPVERAEAERRPNAPDVFDVDAPQSPYVEPVQHDEVARVTPDEELATWSFNDEHDAAASVRDEALPFGHEAGPFAGDALPFDHAAPFEEGAQYAHGVSDADGLHIPPLPQEVPPVTEDVPPLPQDTTLRFDEPHFPDDAVNAEHVQDHFSDDPVDTKLDLARAYLDMGDEEGARLMLDEVMAEGTQMQKDTAKRILSDIV